MKIQKILEQPEDKSLEFKKEIPKNRQNLLKTVVAFANGFGDYIYIGVNDDRTVAGIKEEPFDLEEKLSSIIYDLILSIPNVFFKLPLRLRSVMIIGVIQPLAGYFCFVPPCPMNILTQGLGFSASRLGIGLI
jgi:hypothetical protein